MLCTKPFMLGVMPCGCGQCMACRINRRRLWTHRMLLESVKHVGSCFVTLTYNQETLPGVSLVPKHTQNWLKRLRRAIEPVKVRYFLVGEYGDQTARPHYHAALFGLPVELAGGVDGRGGVVRDTWKLGHTFVGELTQESAAYIGGYVTKKMTKREDPRLYGRHPEFARMSLQPGIGALAMPEIAVLLSGSEWGIRELREVGDVPSALLHGKASKPLGRYLRRVLRKELGLPLDAPFDSYKKFAVEMRVLLEDHAKASPSTSWSLGKVFVDMNKQKVLNLLAKTKALSPRRDL